MAGQVTASLIVLMRASFGEVIKGLDKVSGKFEKTGRNLSRVGADLSRNVSLPIAAALGASVKAAADFDLAFIGVTKTVEETANTSFPQLRARIREMATELPFAATEIAKVAERAGQLGVKADDLEDFVKVMLDLGVSTDLTASDAAVQLKQFINITGLTTGAARDLGNVIVELGNNFATTEPLILDTAKRMASVANLSIFGADQVLAFAAAATSMGAEAELAGSALQTMVINLGRIAQDVNSDKMTLFAKTIGMTNEEAQKLIRTDPATAILKFTNALGVLDKEAGQVDQVLAALGIKEKRLVRFTAALAGGNEQLADALKKAAEQMTGGSALADEAAKFYEAFWSEVKVAKGQVVDLGISIGNILLPVITDSLLPALKQVIDAFQDLSPGTQEAIVKLGLVAAAVGPVVFIMGQLIITAGAVASVLPAISGAVTGIGGAFAAMNTAIANAVLVFGSFFKSGTLLEGLFLRLGVLIESGVILRFVKLGGIIGLTIGIIATFSDAFEAFGGVVRRIFEALKMIATDFANVLYERTVGALLRILGVSEEWQASIKNMFAKTAEFLLYIPNMILEGWVLLAENIGPIMKDLVDFLMEEFDKFFGWITEKFKWVADNVGAVLRGIGVTTAKELTFEEALAATRAARKKAEEESKKGVKKGTEVVEAGLEERKAKIAALQKEIQETLGAGGDGGGGKGGKKTSIEKQIEGIGTAIDKVNSADKFPALAKNIQDIIRTSADADAELKKLGEQWVLNGKNAAVFKDVLSEVRKEEEETAKRTQELYDEVFKLKGGKEQLGEVGREILAIMQDETLTASQAAAAVAALAQAHEDAGGDIEEVANALDLVNQRMSESASQANELAGQLGGVFSSLASSLGVGDSTSGMIGDLLGGLAGEFLGGGGGGSGSLGSLFGGGGGSGDLMGAIGGMFGLGAGESAGFTSLFGGTEAGPLMESGAFFEGGAGASEMLGGSSGASVMGTAGAVIGGVQGFMDADSDEGRGEAIGQAAGAIIGNMIFPVVGGAIGAALGGVIGGAVGGMFGPSTAEMARMMGESWFDTLFEEKGGLSFFNPETGMADTMDSFSFGRADELFGDVSGDNVDNAAFVERAGELFGEGVAASFGTVGEFISDAIGAEEELGAAGALGSLIGVGLADQLGGSFIALEGLLSKMGVTVEDLKNQTLEAAEAGEISWHRATVEMQNLNRITENGINGAQNFAEAFGNLMIAGDRGRAPIMALQKLASEFLDDGINDINEARAALEATGQYTDEQLNTIFQAFAQRGIASMEQLANAETQVLGAIIADAQTLGNTFAGSILPVEEMRDVLMGVKTMAEAIPEKIQTQVDVNVDITETVTRVVEEVAAEAEGSAEQFAQGGVIKSRSFGVVGESGPEAILPLARSGSGVMGVQMLGSGPGRSGGGDGGVTVNVDARGASPGVENNIIAAMEEVERRAIEGAVDAVLDQVQRGGQFGDIFER